MTITFVIPFVNLTGGIRVLIDYANWLHDAGHRVTVVYPLWPYRFHFTRRDQLAEFRKHLRRAPGVDWRALRCGLRRVPWIADAFLPNADVIVTTSWPAAFDVARADPSRGRKVHVVMHHESGTGPEHRIRATYRLPFYRITLSRRVQDALTRRFDCEIHDVAAAGVDTARFFPDGEPADGTVLMLYHPDPRKGAADGIEAAARVRERLPHVRIRMCGTVRPERLPPWIAYDFHPSDAVLRRLYSTSTVFMYPSRDEGFGLPPLEAMACGCAVATTDVGAVSEFAADGRDALIVPPGDVNALADRVTELLRRPQLRKDQARRGLETAARHAVARTAPAFAQALQRAAACCV